jgi:hypothetical protein
MIEEIVVNLIATATSLLNNLGDVFTSVVNLFYDEPNSALTPLGLIIVGTAGFALAWSGIRFIFSFVQRLLNKTRGGAR